jgi:hypothetical protein
MISLELDTLACEFISAEIEAGAVSRAFNELECVLVILNCQ